MSKRPQENENSTIQCVERAFRILGLLSSFEAGVDLALIAKRANLPKSTLVRILKTMCYRGVIQQDAETHKYRLGATLIALAQAARKQANIEELVHPYLIELQQRTGETASYATLNGTHATYVTQALSHRIIRGVPTIGSQLELPCTGVGKALLTYFTHDELDRFLHSHGLRKHTHKTIVNAQHLRQELATIAKQGYAFDDEEIELGKRCIAAPILDSYGKAIAAISITGPSERIRRSRVGALAESVMEIAERISATFQTAGIGT